MLRLGRDDGASRDFFGGFAKRHAVGAHPPGRNGRLRARPALEEAARDQQTIGSLFGRHGGIYYVPGRSAAP
jgi:hypothetical protein